MLVRPAGCLGFPVRPLQDRRQAIRSLPSEPARGWLGRVPGGSLLPLSNGTQLVVGGAARAAIGDRERYQSLKSPFIEHNL